MPMDVKSLIPFRRAPTVSRQNASSDPLAAFREEINRTFDDFFRGLAFPLGFQPARPPALALTPQMDVSETGEQVEITAELPGLDADDVEVSLDGDVLTIQGEKTLQREEDERDYHVVERSQGSFSRSIRLPFEVDPDQIQAAFKDGVLTITVPKPADAQNRVHRIGVKKEQESPEGAMSEIDRAAAGDKPAQGGQSQLP
jgi:HSP20 family protein